MCPPKKMTNQMSTKKRPPKKITNQTSTKKRPPKKKSKRTRGRRKNVHQNLVYHSITYFCCSSNSITKGGLSVVHDLLAQFGATHLLLLISAILELYYFGVESKCSCRPLPSLFVFLLSNQRYCGTPSTLTS